MELMKKIAIRHGLVCLLHEKPFAGVNGSGKHNNWSLATDLGENLLKPGDKPAENKQFLLFLCAIIKAVDTYSDLLRVAVATAGNDHRLGANEAPPAIVSMFLGEQLTRILDSIEKGEIDPGDIKNLLNTGVDGMPVLSKDATDRNRTSPFAFTGNKFEFRMVGSAQSISGINNVINTIVADALCDFADRLEKVASPEDEINDIILDTIKKHKRIIFNGNNYAAEWVKEAERRGLPNYRTTIDALPAFVSKKNIDLFARHGIFTEKEIQSRYEILLEDYSKAINIEALTMLDMARKDIAPACIAFGGDILSTLAVKRTSGLDLNITREEALAEKVSDLTESLLAAIDILDDAMNGANDVDGAYETAKYCREKVFSAMQSMRTVADELETVVGNDYWPFPTYSELLFNV